MRLRPRSLAPIFLLSVTAAGCWTAEAVGIRVNLTPSMPLGIYQLGRSAPERGDLVAACLPESVALFGRSRGYLRAGYCPGGASPVIKRVAAVPGDLVQVTNQGIFVSCRRIQDPPPGIDSQGRALDPVARGDYLLSSGELWLYSPHENSWDSRFYGPVAAAHVLGTVQPLWTAAPILPERSQ